MLLQAHRLQAAGFEGSSPRTPAEASMQPSGILYAQISLCAGSIQLDIWPALMLFNNLPFKLSCKSMTSQPTSFAAPATETEEIQPGSEAALSCTGASDECLALRLTNAEVSFKRWVLL